MNPQVEYSLIVATLGRFGELSTFLDSLENQKFNSSLFEVIIVDQNPEGFLKDLLIKHTDKLSIVHLISPRKSLSHSRNIGIKNARGKYLLFPDDDCQYYSDTLFLLDKKIKAKTSVDVFIGTVFDRKNNTYVFKKTPQFEVKVTVHNFHNFVSSIAISIKNEKILFDENFGIGEKFHSNEDADILLTCIEKGFQVHFCPEVQFYHPPYSSSNMSLEKLKKYGIGFGALCRKHMSLPIFFLFCKVIVYQLLMIIRAIALVNGTELKRRIAALKGRLSGFMFYNSSV